MPQYADGFVIPVPEDKVDAYLEMAREAAAVWREHGALEVRECVGDDVPVGEQTSFTRSVDLQPGETVIFAWIVYESREERDRVNAEVMKDGRIAGMDENAMPFDAKRMIFGGFQIAVAA